MKFEIQQNEKPDLAICKMNVDGGLHKKLEKYELTKFLNRHSINCFLGKPGSGKTSLVYSFFKSNKILKNVYENVYFFQPQASRASMEDSIFDTLPEDKKFDELNEANLMEVLNRIKNEPGSNHCIVFDDVSAYLKSNEVQTLLKEIAMNRRHLHISLFFIVQTFVSLPFEIRRLITNWFVFDVSRQTFEQIFSELVEHITDKNDILYLKRMIYDKKHNFLFLNTETGRMFKGFDEILTEQY
jgi:AAA15 family ATPase/GTPase